MECYQHGCSDGKIAQKCGVSVQAIYRWRRRRNLPPNGKVGDTQLILDPDDDQRRYELYSQGYSDTQIATAVGVRPATILKWRQRRNLEAVGKPGRPRRTE